MMKTLEIKGKELRYLDTGHGFPILFGHSYLWDHKMWAPQIHHLSKSYRCIVPDLWGHGQSDELPRENNDLSDIADDMMTLMRHLKLDDQFAIIGLSVGGMWAAELAYKHPLSIKSIVLMNTFLGEEPPANKAQFLMMFNAIEKLGFIPESIIQQIVPGFFSIHTQENNKTLVDEFTTHLKKKSLDISSLIRLGKMIFERQNRMNLLDAFSEVDIPTLIITGSEDCYRPTQEGELMAQRLPTAQFVEVISAGHISSLDQPLHINRLLEEFFRLQLVKERLWYFE